MLGNITKPRPGASIGRRVAASAALSLLLLAVSLGSLARARSPAVPADVTSSQLTNGAHKVDSALLAHILAEPQRPVSVVVRLHAVEPDVSGPNIGRTRVARRQLVAELQAETAQSQASVLGWLRGRQAQGRVSHVRAFWIFNGLAVTADGGTVLQLAGRPDVLSVREDTALQLVPEPMREDRNRPKPYVGGPLWNIERIRAADVWNMLGLDGSGAVVASMDTGVDWHHPDLERQYRGWRERGAPLHFGNWECATSDCGVGNVEPFDNRGHGTHTLGTAVGSGGTGVAPGASWIAVKVLDGQGIGLVSWLHAGFEWLMAPDGDPDMAPDVINASWSNEYRPEDQEFREDIARLRQAGILTVVSTGNRGIVGAPASMPEALAVGATDQDDRVPEFSGRGDATALKPEIVAPGVAVTSTWLGGGYLNLWGTSMAAPHVSGVVALLRQANPDLTPLDIVGIITRTAQPVHGYAVPSTSAGWGRIDAFAAARTQSTAGYVHGSVVRRGDSRAIPHARIAIQLRDGQQLFDVGTDARGEFELALLPGIYDVVVSAFGYQTVRQLGLVVQDRQDVELEFVLDLTQVGWVAGQVVSADTGGPLAAKMRVDGTPFEVSTDVNGRYFLALPAGSYTVSARIGGYRIVRHQVTVEVGQTVELDFSLPTAPRILLVDGGYWQYESQITYFERALERADYVFDLWKVNAMTAAPKCTTLRQYGLVIWSAPTQGTPGQLRAEQARAGDEIVCFLDAGGRMILSGQDVAYWDGGGSLSWVPYFYRRLHSVYVSDDAPSRTLEGERGGPFEGVVIELNGPASAENQHYPDQLAAANSLYARELMRYKNGAAAVVGTGVGACLKYRSLAIGFGLEGVPGDEARAEFLRRAIDWLLAPPMAAQLSVRAESTTGVAFAGETVTYTLQIHNIGAADVDVTAELVDVDWPTSLWHTGFRQPLQGPLRVTTCSQVGLGVRVDVPTTARRDDEDRFILRLTPQSSSPIELALVSKTPAPVLLVDDDRFYDVEDAYITAMRNAGIPFDRWTVGWRTEGVASPVNAHLLQLYPIVVWFTGYDWSTQLLSADDERTLAQYLDAGGRLALSSQDYLYVRGRTAFARDYLGVVRHTEDLTSTHITGVRANPVGDGLGPYTLSPPYPNHSDGLQLSARALPAFRGQAGQIVGVTHVSDTFKTFFLAASLDGLTERGGQEVMARAVDWFSPLSPSRLSVSQQVVEEGQQVVLTLRVQNESQRPIKGALVEWPVPGELTFEDIRGAQFDPVNRRVTWSGDLSPRGQHEITLTARLAVGLAAGTRVEVTALITDPFDIPLHRKVVLRVNSPDLSSSVKRVSSPSAAQPGDIVSYVLALRNLGTRRSEAASLRDVLPDGLLLLPESLAASSGEVRAEGNAVVWTGAIERGQLVAVSYDARVETFRGGYLTNRAVVTDEFGSKTDLQAAVFVRPHLMFPLIIHRTRGIGP